MDPAAPTYSPDTTHVTELLVLFNINDDEPDPTAQVNAMVNSLSSPLYCTAGPIVRTRPSPFPFTHLLHARFPAHLTARLTAHLHPIPGPSLSLSWAPGPISGPIIPPPGSAFRVTLFSLKEGEKEKEKEEILEGLKTIRESSGGFEQISYGVIEIENENENLVGEERRFNVSALMVFPDLNELDASEEYEDALRSLIEKVKGGIDEIVAVDYVVPRSHSNVS